MVRKKIFIILIFISIFFVGCNSNNDDNKQQILKENSNIGFEDKVKENNKKEIVIVAYGDSLTQGYGLSRDQAYPSQLENFLKEKGYNVKVHNSGFSGETSTAALDRLNWVLQLEPDIVIFTTGANDAFRGISLNLIENNIREVVEILIENNITVILGGMEIVENLGSDYVKNFRNIYINISNDYDIGFIEFFLDGVAGNSSLNLEDEIHPNKAGYKIIVENNIYPILKNILNEY